MKIEGQTIIIDTPMEDEEVYDLAKAAFSNEIQTIKIQNDSLSCAIVQMLWCLKKEKKIEHSSSFLEKLFENVKYL